MKREKQVVVRLNEDEKTKIKRAATKTGTTVAGILRRGGLEVAQSSLGEE